MNTRSIARTLFFLSLPVAVILFVDKAFQPKPLWIARAPVDRKFASSFIDRASAALRERGATTHAKYDNEDGVGVFFKAGTKQQAEVSVEFYVSSGYLLISSETEPEIRTLVSLLSSAIPQDNLKSMSTHTTRTHSQSFFDFLLSVFN